MHGGHAGHDHGAMIADFRRRFWVSRATYGKMIRILTWATGYNAFAIPHAAGFAYPWGIVLGPAIGAVLMSLSTVVVASNAKLLKRARRLVTGAAPAVPGAA
jgi:Cu2+-exporting ATPase